MFSESYEQHQKNVAKLRGLEQNKEQSREQLFAPVAPPPAPPGFEDDSKGAKQ